MRIDLDRLLVGCAVQWLGGHGRPRERLVKTNVSTHPTSINHRSTSCASLLPGRLYTTPSPLQESSFNLFRRHDRRRQAAPTLRLAYVLLTYSSAPITRLLCSIYCLLNLHHVLGN